MTADRKWLLTGLLIVLLSVAASTVLLFYGMRLLAYWLFKI